MFLALIVIQTHNRLHVVVGLFAALLSTLLYLYIPGDSYALLATICTASVGYALQRYVVRTRRRA